MIPSSLLAVTVGGCIAELIITKHMERMNIEGHRELTRAHLSDMEVEAAEAAELRAEDRYRREIGEREPIGRDVRLNRLTPTQKEFDHEQAAHNKFDSVEADEKSGSNGISWQRRRQMLEEALNELDALFALLGPSIVEHPEKTDFRAKIAAKIVDMDRFRTERYLLKSMRGLDESPRTAERLMEEEWEATLADPISRLTVDMSWRSLLDITKRIFRRAKEIERERELTVAEESELYRFMLRKLDAAISVKVNQPLLNLRKQVLEGIRDCERRTTEADGDIISK